MNVHGFSFGYCLSRKDSCCFHNVSSYKFALTANVCKALSSLQLKKAALFPLIDSLT